MLENLLLKGSMNNVPKILNNNDQNTQKCVNLTTLPYIMS